jgi:hypothetical protein
MRLIVIETFSAISWRNSFNHVHTAQVQKSS